MTQEPLYPFGFGLSYSRFEYVKLVLEKSAVDAGESSSLSAKVSNAGECAAAEVALVHLSDLDASVPVPRHHLVGFERVLLQPGENRTLQFTLTPERMSFFDERGELRLDARALRLEVGGCSPGERGLALGAPAPVTAMFRVS